MVWLVLSAVLFVLFCRVGLVFVDLLTSLLQQMEQEQVNQRQWFTVNPVGWVSDRRDSERINWQNEGF